MSSPVDPACRVDFDDRARQRRLEAARLEAIAAAMLPRALGGDLQAAKIVTDCEARKAAILSPDLIPRGELKRALRNHRDRLTERHDEVTQVFLDHVRKAVLPTAFELFRNNLLRDLENLRDRWSLEDSEADREIDDELDELTRT